jgi:enoyl-CoA hydratase
MELPYIEGDVLFEKEIERQIAVITLNRPSRLNALTHEMERRIRDFIIECEGDDEVKLIVFKGAGRAFCSGADLEEAYNFYFRPGEDTHRRPSQRRRVAVSGGGLWGKHGLVDAIFYCVKPTLGVIQGRCFGAGMDLLMACDIAVASEDTIFGHPGFTYHGFGGDLASYIFHMGLKRAKGFTLTARPIDAETAVSVGLVNEIVPLGSLEVAADSWIADITRLPFDALVMQKAHYKTVLDGLGFATNFSAAHQAISWASNVRLEPGENSMTKDKEKMSVADTIKARKDYFGHW